MTRPVIHSFIVKTTSFGTSSRAKWFPAIKAMDHQLVPHAHPDVATTLRRTSQRLILRYAVILDWVMVLYSLFRTALCLLADASIDATWGSVYGPSEYTTMPKPLA